MQSDIKHQVSETVRRRVLRMELQPGELLDESALAAEFGVSRTPLREVIQRLCGEGYLVLEQNRGAKVAPMDFATMRHFFQAAPMIYAAISRLAAEQAEQTGIGRLKEIQRDYRNALKHADAAETAMHNHAFHRQIGEMAASPYLIPSLNRLLIDHTRIGQTFYRSASAADKTRITKAAAQHDALIDALERNAAAEAVDLTLEHWALSRDDIERFVWPDPLDFKLAGEFERKRDAV